jgi:cobalt transporter subunit CbtA
VAELRRIVWLAVVAGFVAGVVTTAAQVFTTVPLIVQAEAYEHAAASHAHERIGLVRSANTLLFNVLAGIGFGLILSALLSSQRGTGVRQGLVLGAAAFLAVTLAPALGLPPELPGTASADLSARQFWWIGTGVASAIGLAMLVLGKGAWLKAAGVVLLLVPHIIGAPLVENMASGPPPALQRQFVAASLGTTALFWLVLGAALGWLYRIDRLPRSPPHSA